QEHGVVVAFLGSAVAVLATLLIAWILPLPRTDEEEGNDLVDIGYAPEPSLALTMRSGPVVVEVEYDVDPAAARDFYQVMLRMERVRKRIGAFDWSISRDVANPAIWIERYRCATWGDYLRMRDRYTQTDFEVQEAADAFNRSGTGRRVRRRLERPYGSVRWKSDSPDLYKGTVDYFAP
ncbi:MAG TPA: MFS transporter, partial [Novosphingobium sp.]|nr:MFS transporter [Novosphingobium sp.]